MNFVVQHQQQHPQEDPYSDFIDSLRNSQQVQKENQKSTDTNPNELKILDINGNRLVIRQFIEGFLNLTEKSKVDSTRKEARIRLLLTKEAISHRIWLNSMTKMRKSIMVQNRMLRNLSTNHLEKAEKQELKLHDQV